MIGYFNPDETWMEVERARCCTRLGLFDVDGRIFASRSSRQRRKLTSSKAIEKHQSYQLNEMFFELLEWEASPLTREKSLSKESIFVPHLHCDLQSIYPWEMRRMYLHYSIIDAKHHISCVCWMDGYSAACWSWFLLVSEWRNPDARSVTRVSLWRSNGMMGFDKTKRNWNRSD